MKKIPAVLLMGPTASGKSGVALELAAALGGEIISVDSAQVYRGMDIGSAKPTAAQQAAVPHHLIDVLDPVEPYSAARFRDDALRLVAEIRRRGRVPLLVGGTMLYFHALLQGLSRLPAANPVLRERWAGQAQEQGWPAMHQRLARVDPESAARLHPNDGQRILRALEIVELSGGTVAKAQGARDESPLPGPVVSLALWVEDRAKLHRQIERRFRQMMTDGFAAEVAKLHARPELGPDLPSMRAVGYRQLWAHLDGSYDLETAVVRGIAATRRLAKRQCTWLRSMPGVSRIDAEDPGRLARARHEVEQAALGGA